MQGATANMNYVAVLCRLRSSCCELHRNYRLVLGWQTADMCSALGCGREGLGCCKQNLLQDQEREMQ